MLMMFVAQAAATAAAPAPRVTVAVPPPVIMRSSGEEAGPRTRVAVSMRTPRGIVWQGELWVGSRGTSSWRESISEPDAQPCVGQWQYGGGQRETSISLGPLNAYGPAAVETLTVHVRWSRPVDEPCGGVRTIELRQPIRLPASGPVTITGDGGLVVEVRRR